MKILVSADLHANIYAAEEIIKIAKNKKCDLHIHIGDSINIGPWPNETVDILRSNNVVMLKGNHEEFCTSVGLSNAFMNIISENELNHYKWSKSCLSEDNIQYLDKLKYQEDVNICGTKISFLHFFKDKNRISEFNLFDKGIENNNLDELFNIPSDIVIFAHLHSIVDITQIKRYLSFGSSGCTGKYCNNKSIGIIESFDKKLRFEKIQLNWKPELIRKELNNKKVPDRELISQIFMN